ncbi:Ig-like domain-containing protein [Streptomyces broussonetiae]|uniref:Ig-like domain-containing protein n=1 Tax=Streptomyces broussonetiae TaxID=2686304 RepID=A0ABV5E6S8_9ACTN
MTEPQPFRRAAAVLAACAVLTLGLVALVLSQSQPARAAASMGEFGFAVEGGSFDDPEPFGPSLTTPAACPDYEFKDDDGNVLEAIPINYTLTLLVANPGGGTSIAIGSITSATPYDSAKTASLAEADNPDLGLRNLSEIFTSDGTYDLQLVCLDDFGGAHPDGGYWSQRITVTGNTWAVGEGAKATQTALAAAPSVARPGEQVTFTATVSPAGATGSMTFLEGETELGTAPVTDGTATWRTALDAGPHLVTARFGPDDTAKWGVSVSEPFQVNVELASYEMFDAAGKLLPSNPELERGQTVKLVVRGCEAGVKHSVALSGSEAAFPDATADGAGTATWAALVVPDDAVAGANSWDVAPDCVGQVQDVDRVPFTVGEPSSSGSPSASPSDDEPSDEPVDEPSDDPGDDPSDDPTADPTGDTSGAGGDHGGAVGSGGTGGASGGGGLASTGSQLALVSGVAAVVLVAAGVFFVRFGRRGGLLTFGGPDV